ncbi:MAG: hypothetical protein IPP71_18260 [Bacteroidetes bacterium]|nr:hypothetical protein [Bacteroidota bacterium]
MNSLKLNFIPIFVIFLYSSQTYSQDSTSSIINSSKYKISANVSFERSGTESYEAPRDFQIVNNFGIAISKKISKRFWIEFNPQLIKHKTKIFLDLYGDYLEYSFISDNIRIPINLEMYLKSFYFKVGPFCDFLIDIRSDSNTNFNAYNVNDFTYGIAAATGMENRIYKNLYLFVEVRYNQVLNTSIYPKNNKSYEGRFVNYGFNIGLCIYL